MESLNSESTSAVPSEEVTEPYSSAEVGPGNKQCLYFGARQLQVNL